MLAYREYPDITFQDKISTESRQIRSIRKLECFCQIEKRQAYIRCAPYVFQDGVMKR